jgi:hypothetical protein
VRDRRKKRVSVSKEVVINKSVRAEGLDMSEDGMYIYTRAGFIPGSIVEIGMTLDGKPVRFSATVQHAQPGVGIGVRFMGLTDKSSAVIRDYLSKKQKD